MNATAIRTQLENLWATRPVRPAAPRTVAGVCAGISARYRVDPTLIKVAFVVSTVFGGSGALLYIAAWICCPSTRHVHPDTLPAHRARTAGNPSTILLVVAIVIALTTVGSGLWGSGGLVGLVLMLLGWWLLYQRTPDAPPHTAISTLTPAAGPERFERWTPRAVRTGSVAVPVRTIAPTGVTLTKPAPTTRTPAAPTAGVADTGVPTTGVPDSSTPDATAIATSPAADSDPFVEIEQFDRVPPAWDPLGAARFAWDLPEPSTPAAPAQIRPRRSPLGLIVLGIAVIVAAAGAALNRSGIAWFTVSHIAALSLAVVGAGLLVGGILRRDSGRRATGLVPIAIILGIFVVISTTLTTWDPTANNLGLPAGGIGERNWKPQSENEVRDSYTLSMGQLNLDLSDITLDSDRTIDLRNGVGEIAVTVPKDINVRTKCSTSIGDFTCPEGLSVGTAGVDAPVLTINAHTAMGNVVVNR